MGHFPPCDVRFERDAGHLYERLRNGSEVAGGRAMDARMIWAAKLELGWIGGRGGVILVEGFCVYNRFGGFASNYPHA